MTSAIVETPRGCMLYLHVVPRASRTRMVGYHGDRVKIQIAAPPVDGKANAEIIKHLAKTLRIQRADLEITQGLTGRQKAICIPGVSAQQVGSRLGL